MTDQPLNEQQAIIRNCKANMVYTSIVAAFALAALGVVDIITPSHISHATTAAQIVDDLQQDKVPLSFAIAFNVLGIAALAGGLSWIIRKDLSSIRDAQAQLPAPQA